MPRVHRVCVADDHIVSFTSSPQRAHIPYQVKQILQEQLPRFSLQVNPEIEAKTNLLKSDPALYQLYNDLVVSRLISAEEFWANRFTEGKLLAGTSGVKGQTAKVAEEEQEIGLPSAFLVQ